MMKRFLSLILSLAIIAEMPGLGATLAFAAVQGSKGSGGPAPVSLSLPASNVLPGNLAVPVVNVAPVVPGSQIPALGGVNNAVANTSSQAALKAAPGPKDAPKAAAQAAKKDEGVSAEALAANPDVTAAVDSANPDGQVPALQKVYENVGPGKKDRAVFINADGPIFNVQYHPANKLKRGAVNLNDGRTPVHVLVGTGGRYGRAWSSDMVGEEIAEIAKGEVPGLQRVVIVHSSEKDPVKEVKPSDVAHVIYADLLDLTPANKEKIAKDVVDYLEKNNLVALGANTTVQGFIRAASVVQEALQKGNNPNIPVNPLKAVEATVDKLATREIVGQHVETLKWPAVSPGTVDDPELEEKAVAVFREIQPKVPSGEVVLKLVTAAGKAGLRAKGIKSEADMRAAVRDVLHELNTYWAEHADKARIYIQDASAGPSRMLIEGKIDRLAEVDVEVTSSVLEDGVIDATGFIIGNPAPGEAEKGYLFGMDGLLSKELQRSLVLSAIEAVRAVWHQFEGVPFGNFHVEIILRGDARDPKNALVEINATRPIGGNGVRIAREWHGELNLFGGGVRGSMGLAQRVLESQPKDSLLLLGISAQASGTVKKAEVPADMAQAKFSDFGAGKDVAGRGPVYIPLSEAGEAVHGLESPQSDAVGAMAVRGKDAPDAVKNMLAGLKRAEYTIETEDGRAVEFDGTVEHTAADYRALPEAAPLTVEEKEQIKAYVDAQTRWTPVFMVYSPLFSAVMNAMGGIAAIGIGRLGYTLALFVSSPLASVVSSYYPVRTVLKYAWAARVAIWAALMPLAVLLVPAGTPLIAAIFALNFLDGLVVSFSHPVDLDAGGINEVARQGGFDKKITPDNRKEFFVHYNVVASRARMYYPLAISLLVAGAAALALPVHWAFMLGMAGFFAWSGVTAIAKINKMSAPALEKPTEGVLKQFTEGVKMVKNDRKLVGLISLEALERSMQDIMIMIALPMLGLFALQPALGLDKAGANLAATFIGSIMAFASLKAGNLVRARWKAPAPGEAEHPAYKPLYKMMLIAGVTTLAFPLAYGLIMAGGTAMVASGIALAVLGAVAFMFAFKAPQIGAYAMFSTATAQHKGQTRIFGLSSTLQMLVAGLTVWALGSTFPEIAKGQPIPDATFGFAAVAAAAIVIGALYRMIWPLITSRDAATPKNTGHLSPVWLFAAGLLALGALFAFLSPGLALAVSSAIFVTLGLAYMTLYRMIWPTRATRKAQAPKKEENKA